MEIKSLILGLVFGLGIFALKSGIGLGYLLAVSAGRSRKTALFSWHLLAYGALFPVSWLVLTQVSLLAYFPQLQKLFASGMALHLISACLMAGWGSWLLVRARPVQAGLSKGWLLLSLPCPVCATVILLETAFIMALYPDHSVIAMGGMAAVFSVIQSVSAVFFCQRFSINQSRAEQLLGQLMCGLAGYFLLSLCMVPQFSQIDRIYRLAAAVKGQPLFSSEIIFVLAIVCAVVMSGWLLRSRAIKRSY